MSLYQYFAIYNYDDERSCFTNLVVRYKANVHLTYSYLKEWLWIHAAIRSFIFQTRKQLQYRKWTLSSFFNAWPRFDTLQNSIYLITKFLPCHWWLFSKFLGLTHKKKIWAILTESKYKVLGVEKFTASLRILDLHT